MALQGLVPEQSDFEVFYEIMTLSNSVFVCLSAMCEADKPPFSFYSPVLFLNYSNALVMSPLPDQYRFLIEQLRSCLPGEPRQQTRSSPVRFSRTTGLSSASSRRSCRRDSSTSRSSSPTICCAAASSRSASSGRSRRPGPLEDPEPPLCVSNAPRTSSATRASSSDTDSAKARCLQQLGGDSVRDIPGSELCGHRKVNSPKTRYAQYRRARARPCWSGGRIASRERP